MFSHTVLLSALAAICASSPTFSSYSSYVDPVPAGFSRSNDGVEAVYRNDLRQEHVNHIAEKHQTGTGTAKWYGVPGTNIDFTNSRVLTNSYPQSHQSMQNYVDTRQFGSGKQYFGGSTGPAYQPNQQYAPQPRAHYQPPPPPQQKSEVHYSYGYYQHH